MRKGTRDPESGRTTAVRSAYGRSIRPLLLGLLVLAAALWTVTNILRQAYTAISTNNYETSSSLVNQAQSLEDPQARFIREDKFSIIISTYNRYETFLYLLNHYGTQDLPHLDAIFINWALGAVDPPSSLNLSSYRVPVHLRHATNHSLGERFHIPAQMRTDAALWLDDDMQLGASTVEFLFRAWKSLGQRDHRIVGNHPRLPRRNQAGLLKYTAAPSATYKLILTGVAFMDKTMAGWYWEDDPLLAQAREYVDRGTNCEDLLMNYIAARKTRLPPVLAVPVSGGIKRIKTATALSLKASHVAGRAMCLQKFESLFGDILIESDLALIQSFVVGDIEPQIIDLPEDWKPKGQGWGDGRIFKEARLVD